MGTQTRPPYVGTARKLVIALDVGTTFSGISYSLLDPGNVPEITNVVKFPDQENISTDSKVPTIIWYGPDGKVKAIGAGAVSDGIGNIAEDGGWVKVEWFKLYLRPKNLSIHHKDEEDIAEYMKDVPPIPTGKTIVDVYADFLRYLYDCTKVYVEEHHTNGGSLWGSLVRTTEFVISHPNGWEGPQQTELRRAVVKAGLVPDNTNGAKRVHFVTEGEASLHFCISRGLTTASVKEGSGVVVVDAGGGTIDVTTYCQSEITDGQQYFEEAAIPRCYLRGSSFVSKEAGRYLKSYLANSKFVDEVPEITREFDRAGKHRFHTTENPVYVKFGSKRDNEFAYDIRAGCIKLQGSTVGMFFQPSIDRVVEAIRDSLRSTKARVRTAFLVGGFAASDWLFNQVKEYCQALPVDICRADGHLNKAVTEGAISFFIDRSVKGRKSRFVYGTRIRRQYEPEKADHYARRDQAYIDVDGKWTLGGMFSIGLHKNQTVREESEFRISLTYPAKTKERLCEVCCIILRYEGKERTPEWVDEEKDLYTEVCAVYADTSVASQALVQQTSDVGGYKYYALKYDVVLFFGLTELKAQIVWVENGEEKRGPAEIIFKGV